MRGVVETHREHSREKESAIASSVDEPSGRASQFGKWRVSKSKSQFDDSQTVVLTLAAENSIKGWLATSIPQLILRCQEGRTKAYVVTGMPAAVEYGEVERHTVRLRYGEDAAFSVLMSQSTDNKSLFFPDPVMKIVGLWNVPVLLVGFIPEPRSGLGTASPNSKVTSRGRSRFR